MTGSDIFLTGSYGIERQNSVSVIICCAIIWPSQRYPSNTYPIGSIVQALVDELQRSREVEQALDKQKEDLKSKFEQSQEAKLRLEEDLATTRHQLHEIQKENRKLLGSDDSGGTHKMFKTPLRRAVLAEQN